MQDIIILWELLSSTWGQLFLSFVFSIEIYQAVPDSSPNEINLNGESLLIATIKYLDDEESRVSYSFTIINNTLTFDFPHLLKLS